MPSHSSEPRTYMNISGEGIASVWHGGTKYQVVASDPTHGISIDQLTVELVEGPDVLEHDFVCDCAMDAFLDAYGVM